MESEKKSPSKANRSISSSVKERKPRRHALSRFVRLELDAVPIIHLKRIKFIIHIVTRVLQIKFNGIAGFEDMTYLEPFQPFTGTFNLYELIEMVFLARDFPNTLYNLNLLQLSPTKDYNNNKLTSGLQQLPPQKNFLLEKGQPWTGKGNTWRDSQTIYMH
ncbi:hypothetical protein HA402_008867 [Bradysia odoriphaga]|nr:hypothetical protein HA402_008867 [Bradysia odoriphaga]